MAAHLGHRVCRLPLGDVASHVRVKQLLNSTLYPLEDFRKKKNEYHF